VTGDDRHLMQPSPWRTRVCGAVLAGLLTGFGAGARPDDHHGDRVGDAAI